MKKLLKGVIPISVYFIALIIINIWYLSYYGTTTALDIAVLYYVPYCLGGAFVMCLIQGILVRKLSGTNKVIPMFLYLAILVFCAYFIIWFDEALMQSYPDFIYFYKQGVPFSYGISKVDTPLILLETTGGFLLGWFIRNRKERRIKAEQGDG